MLDKTIENVLKHDVWAINYDRPKGLHLSDNFFSCLCRIIHFKKIVSSKRLLSGICSSKYYKNMKKNCEQFLSHQDIYIPPIQQQSVHKLDNSIVIIAHRPVQKNNINITTASHKNISKANIIEYRIFRHLFFA